MIVSTIRLFLSTLQLIHHDTDGTAATEYVMLLTLVALVCCVVLMATVVDFWTYHKYALWWISQPHL